MFKKLTLAGAAFATLAGGVAATPAMAQRYDRGYGYDRGYNDGYGYDRGYRNYRGYDRRYVNRQNPCKDGDGGTVIGAIAGGLAGNALAGRGDRTLGAILGGALGAVAGRAIDKSDPPRGCARSR
ncbi:glycine zipper 2TM domain-containing protein [uncultured Sphingomonas sp.]|uniref:glycine zipper 2TM domain-containing protein n=1 Tax=uncultured Sphingomonas sp. TaxID=158754 RepID=UPI0025D3F071|nr:glycine zipper 2TM domain-containing protein [uncultured Sphingomonas sp.]